MIQIVRRLGTSPRARGSVSGQNCPDIFELADGNFAVIGTDATNGLDAHLPTGTPLTKDDRIVVVTRETLIHAKTDIPLGVGSSRTPVALLRAGDSQVDGSRAAIKPVNRGGQQQVEVEIVRRLGKAPRQRRSSPSVNAGTCPDIFELSDGNFAIIGTEATEALDRQLPADASRADYERIVVISRETLIEAKKDIPDA